jgi:hypothetical protein
MKDLPGITRRSHRKDRRRHYRITSNQAHEVAYQISKPPSVTHTDAEMLFHYLVALLQGTTFPNNVSSQAEQVKSAFRALDVFLSNPVAEPWKIRIGFWRMEAMIHDLLAIVKLERYQSKFCGRSGEGDKTIALEIHSLALSETTRPDQVKLHWRLAKRWSEFAQGSLLSLLFTVEARPEKIMYVL